MGRCFKGSFDHMSEPAAVLFLSLFRHVSKSFIVRWEARDTSEPRFAMVIGSSVGGSDFGDTSLVCSWYGGADARCAGTSTDCAFSFLCEKSSPSRMLGCFSTIPWSGCWIAAMSME